MVAGAGTLGLLALGLVAATGDCPDGASGEALFPPSTFSTNPEVDNLAHRWHGQFLRAFGERSLACAGGERDAGDDTDETYRLLWTPSTTRMRTPGVHPLLVVVTRVSAETWITGKTLPSRREPAAGKSSSRRLTAAEWRALQALLERADFWQAVRMGPAAIDGDQWLLEGRRPGRYQAMARSYRLGAFGEAAHHLLKLAGLTLPR